jgi:hypothetical protein
MSWIALAAALAFTAAPPSKPDAPGDATRDHGYATRIQPILFAKCTPCHVPGGKMYARLPFDDPATVRAHSAGVLRRLKGEDKAAVEAWLEEK